MSHIGFDELALVRPGRHLASHNEVVLVVNLIGGCLAPACVLHGTVICIFAVLAQAQSGVFKQSTPTWQTTACLRICSRPEV